MGRIVENAMPDNIFNFIMWVRRNTEHIQDNVVRYKGVMYFTDIRTIKNSGTDGGLDDLWAMYIKSVLG